MVSARNIAAADRLIALGNHFFDLPTSLVARRSRHHCRKSVGIGLRAIGAVVIVEIGFAIIIARRIAWAVVPVIVVMMAMMAMMMIMVIANQP